MGTASKKVPPATEIRLSSRLLHDWPDEPCLRILRNCRTAVAPGTVLLLIETLLEPDPTRGQPADHLIDMQMMAMFGTGRPRSEKEFRELLAKAGYRCCRTVPTTSSVSVLEAVAI